MPHVGRKYLLNIDFKDFFPSISYSRIKIELMKYPFNMNDEFAHFFAYLSCFNDKLPQGAPTSPILTNIICKNLDNELSRFSINNTSYYSRYVDDITFSSMNHIFDNKFKNNIIEIIYNEGFRINNNKTRLQNNKQRQVVTGIIVNEKLNVIRPYIRQIRAMLFSWEKLGLQQAELKFIKYYKKEKGFLRNRGNITFTSVLDGKIQFLGMVRGKGDLIFLRYRRKYLELSNNEKSILE